MGNTITGKCAAGYIKDRIPWIKSQVVVTLSRIETVKDITIVRPCSEAIAIIWSLITRCNQWTEYTEILLGRLTLCTDSDAGGHAMIFDCTEAYLLCVSDINLSTHTLGYVYFLVSGCDFDRDYISQTKCLAMWLQEYSSGYGSSPTSDPFCRPYCVAAYITGLGTLDTRGREDLEEKWKCYRLNAITNRGSSIDAGIEAGTCIVQECNDFFTYKNNKIKLIVTIKRKSASCTN